MGNQDQRSDSEISAPTSCKGAKATHGVFGKSSAPSATRLWIIRWSGIGGIGGMIAVCAACCIPAPCVAKEPAAAFIAKLKERGYHDVVKAYTDRLRASGTQVEGVGSFDSLDAITSAQLAVNELDPKKRDLLMADAKTRLIDFTTKHPDDPAIDEASEWLRKILFATARTSVARAGLSMDDDEKRELLAKGATEFAETQKAVDAHVEMIKQRLIAFREQPAEERDLDTSQQLKSDYLQAKLTAATVLLESAAALESDPAAREKRLDAASKAGAKLIEQYHPDYAAGWIGMWLEGQALHELGKNKEAVEVLTELSETDRPDLRGLAAKATGKIVDCHVAEKTPDKGIEVGEKWLKAGGMADRNSRPIRELELAIAAAYGDQSLALKDDAQRKAAAKARSLALPIARTPGPLQGDAKKLLAALPGDAVSTPTKVEDLATYADAKLAGDQAAQEAQTAAQTAEVLKGKVARSPAAKKAELVKEIEDLKAQSVLENQKALQYFRQAIRLAPEETDVLEINRMRLIICIAHYTSDDFYRASVVGEFLARRFPDGPTARKGASVAMAAYYKIHESANEVGDAEEAKMAMGRLVSIANYLASKWPEQQEAQQALITLVQFMVNQGKLKEAEAYLNKIPADSSRRGQADLMIGQAIWSKYTAGMQAAGGETTPQLDALKAQAQKILKSGIDRMKPGGPSPTLANAMLNLARIYNDSGEPAKALALLNDPKVGPKTLVDKKHPSVAAANFDSVTYKTTLQSLLASIATAPDKAVVMKQAESVMDQMKKVYGDDEMGKKRLIANFRAMAKELQAQLSIASPNQKEPLANGIETFLLQVQAASNEFNVLYWVAETMYSLGESFVGADGTLLPPAEKYFKNAADAYANIIQRSDDGKLELPDNLKTQVRMKAASTQSRLGNYAAAIEQFTRILKRNEKMLNIQFEAADTYKAAGIAISDKDMLTKALKGDEKNVNTGRNVIWGYEQISRLVAPSMDRNEKMRDAFFRSRYEAADCRFQQSKITGEEKYLDSTHNILGRIRGSYPELGGPTWKPRFEKLFQQVGLPPADPAATP